MIHKQPNFIYYLGLAFLLVTGAKCGSDSEETQCKEVEAIIAQIDEALCVPSAPPSANDERPSGKKSSGTVGSSNDLTHGSVLTDVNQEDEVSKALTFIQYLLACLRQQMANIEQVLKDGDSLTPKGVKGIRLCKKKVDLLIAFKGKIEEVKQDAGVSEEVRAILAYFSGLVELRQMSLKKEYDKKIENKNFEIQPKMDSWCSKSPMLKEFVDLGKEEKALHQEAS